MKFFIRRYRISGRTRKISTVDMALRYLRSPAFRLGVLHSLPELPFHSIFPQTLKVAEKADYHISDRTTTTGWY